MICEGIGFVILLSSAGSVEMMMTNNQLIGEAGVERVQRSHIFASDRSSTSN
jgi:hypothetical protein